MVSTVLIMEVSAGEASAFRDYWAHLTTKPGAFHLLGYNCSTHASEAYEHAGI